MGRLAFIKTLVEEIEAESLLSRDDRVVVGVSGGPDSMALLHALVDLNHECAYSLDIHIAHLDHQLRNGDSEKDAAFVQALGMEIDERSHREEHSIETQVPFIKHRFPRARIAPIMVGDQDMPAAVLLGGRIARAVRETSTNVRIVASSDFSHYVPEHRARSDDLYAIEGLRNLDIPEFYRRIEERGVSACGYGPIAAMCTTCAAAGAREARLIRYSTSGDITRDTREVVGYAAIAVV